MGGDDGSETDSPSSGEDDGEPSSSSDEGEGGDAPAAAPAESAADAHNDNPLLGVAASVSAACTSGFAGGTCKIYGKSSSYSSAFVRHSDVLFNTSLTVLSQ